MRGMKNVFLNQKFMNTILTRFVKHALITCGGLEILNFRFTMSVSQIREAIICWK